ncbi:MAG: hypothetical protein H6907_10570 [Hyphomicrobiales bacterium]|nr:hypothetical protein [Hyphomicrobiales bacterium]
MNTAIIHPVAGALLFLSAHTSLAAPLEQGPLTLQILGHEFRMTDAFEARFGAWGRARYEPVPHGFERRGQLDVTPTPVRVGELLESDFAQLGGEAQARVAAASGSVLERDRRSYTIVVEMTEDTRSLIDAINGKSAADRTFLEKVRNEDFRVVTAVARVFNHAAHQDLVAKIEAHGKPPAPLPLPLPLSVGGSLIVGSNSRTALSDGSQIAYIYSRICWKNGQIFSLVQDKVKGYFTSRGCDAGSTRFYQESLKN